jgi:hypothetical protein
MEGIERGVFVKLFNRGGYVLDFSTTEFDMFTLEHVGVALCEKYHMSKGRSLNAYIQEASEEQADKLLFELLKYYELSYPNFERETVPDENGKVQYDCGVDYSVIYKKCKAIQSKYSNPLTTYTDVLAKNITDVFSTEYIDWQAQVMLSMQSTNPTEAIGKAKEIVESCCKGIFELHSLQVDKNWDLPKLTKETMKLLSVHADQMPNTPDAQNIIKPILGSLLSIANNIAELRNKYGSGHGKSPNYKGLEERHARLAVGSALTLVNFLWDSHLRKTAKNQ